MDIRAHLVHSDQSIKVNKVTFYDLSIGMHKMCLYNDLVIGTAVSVCNIGIVVSVYVNQLSVEE